jgi:hypothetical protein
MAPQIQRTSGDASRDTEALSFCLVLKATTVHLGITEFTIRSGFSSLNTDEVGFSNHNG